MLTLPSALAMHLSGRVLSLTICWAVTRSDGKVLRGTAHDRDITISSGDFAGTYPARATIYSTDVASKSDGSVSNVDVEGAFFADVDELTVEDIEGGFFDQAPAVVFMVNWQNPDAGQKVLLAGTLGEFYRDSEGRYRSEVRGLTQALKQQIVRTYSERCDVKLFGDARCKFDVASVTRTGTVSGVTNRKRFDVTLDPGDTPKSPVYFVGGRLQFTSGVLDGVVREVRACIVNETNDAAQIALSDEAPADIEVGTTISLPPGCDRTADACRLIHDNFVNFRGHGLFAVGRDALMRGPTQADRTISVEGRLVRKVITPEQYQQILGAIDQGSFFS